MEHNNDYYDLYGNRWSEEENYTDVAAFPFWASSLLSGVPGTALTAIVLSLLLKENKTDDIQKGDEE